MLCLCYCPDCDYANLRSWLCTCVSRIYIRVAACVCNLSMLASVSTALPTPQPPRSVIPSLVLTQNACVHVLVVVLQVVMVSECACHSQISMPMYWIAVSVKTSLTWPIHTISISVSLSRSSRSLRSRLQQRRTRMCTRMPASVASSSSDTTITAISATAWLGLW